MPTSSLPALFVFSFVLGFGAVISPGPVSTAIVSQSPRGGWTVGPIISTGHAFIELLLTILIVFGLSTILAYPAVRVTIAFLGGFFLLWMGGGMLLSTLKGSARLPGLDVAARPLTRLQIMTLGMLTTVTNPFWYAWWITVAAGYLAQAKTLGIPFVTAFYLGHVSADYGWNTALSTILGSGRHWITSGLYRIIFGLCGIFLVYLGITFILQGINSFL